jgi:hypothetical protein
MGPAVRPQEIGRDDAEGLRERQALHPAYPHVVSDPGSGPATVDGAETVIRTCSPPGRR